MNKKTNWKLIACIFVSLLSVYALLPTLWMLNNPNKEAQLPKWMPSTAMKLGLDLRGGIHMVMGVDLDQYVKGQLINYGKSLERAAKEKAQVEVKTSLDDKTGELLITLVNAADKGKLDAFMAKDFTTLTIVNEETGTLYARIRQDQDNYLREHAIDQSIETIRNRIDEFGVAEPVIQRRGDNQILVQFPGEQEPERLKGLIGQTAKLSFQMVHECTDRMSDCMQKQRADIEGKIQTAEKAGNYTRETFKRFSEYRTRLNDDIKKLGKDGLPENTEIAFEKMPDPNQVGKFNYIPYLLSIKDQVSGEYIENAYVTLNREGGMGAEQPVVAFQMNAVGTPHFADLTSNFVHHYMAIVLDGMIRSAPVINSPITGGSGIITVGRGGFDDQNKEARDLSIVLRAGALPAKIESQEERVIGPSIGEDAIVAGKNALLLTSILIAIFMWIYYGVSGLVANFAVGINIAMIFAVLGAVGATLTLPGIAGIVLTISMSVDALIIIFERMREELRAGHNRKQVINFGFDRAFSTILDSNATTAIGAFVLLNYGTGSIRGFALTLLIGIFTNVIMATTFSKIIFESLFSNDETKLSMGLSATELAEAQA